MANKDNDKKMITELSKTSKLSGGEKTEDDVENEMTETQRCDGTCNTIFELKDMNKNECNHTFCEKCFNELKKEEHTSEKCQTKTKEGMRKETDLISDLVNPEASVSRLSAKVMESEPNLQSEVSKVIKAAEKKRVQREKKEKEWYSFLHLEKPIAVLLPQDATYGDLIRKLALFLTVNLETHDICLKVQPSSSSSSADHQSCEPTPIAVDSSKAKLCTLRIPKSKMLIVEIMEKRKKDSPDPPSKSGSERNNQVVGHKTAPDSARKSKE